MEAFPQRAEWRGEGCEWRGGGAEWWWGESQMSAAGMSAVLQTDSLMSL